MFRKDAEVAVLSGDFDALYLLVDKLALRCGDL